jgi:hypothetical protein
VFEGELENVLRGFVGIGRCQFGNVEGLAHRAGFLVIGARALCGGNVNKKAFMRLNNQIGVLLLLSDIKGALRPLW